MESGVGVAVAQVGEHEQCLTAGIRAPSSGPVSRPFRAEEIAQADERKRSAGEVPAERFAEFLAQVCAIRNWISSWS
jgi:hypothetical protein